MERSARESLLQIPASEDSTPVSYPLLDLVGTYEIRQLLGVSRQRAFMVSYRAGFPKPVAELASGRIWNRGDVVAWVRVHRPEAYARITWREAEGL